MPVKVRASSMYGEIKALQQFPLRKKTIDIITKYSGKLNIVHIKVKPEIKEEILAHSYYFKLPISGSICCTGKYGELQWNLLL
jgi:hypothetical protein